MSEIKAIVAVMALAYISGASAAAVQLGTFVDPVNASGVVSRVQAMGYYAVTEQQGGFQSVRIGNVPANEAQRICDRLKASGIGCFISGGSVEPPLVLESSTLETQLPTETASAPVVFLPAPETPIQPQLQPQAQQPLAQQPPLQTTGPIYSNGAFP